MHTIHLRINDAATGRPTPVRLCVTGPDGTPYPPLGRFPDFPVGKGEDVGGGLLVGRERWFPVDGACELPLPAGVPLRVRATKGPEYAPLDQTVTLGPGQMALRFAVGRRSDVRADGWVPGDSRCHTLPPHAARLEAAAEDVDFVNLLVNVQDLPSTDGTVYRTAPNLAAVSGQSTAVEADGRAVVVNTLNVHPALGSVGLLNSHRPVFPLTFGGEDPDDWSVCDWCDQCHRKGGLVVWVDAFRPAGGLVGGEALVAAILGKVDAVEVDAGRRLPLPWLYHLWNAGFPLPLVGGSGKDSNRVAIGAVRTYARLLPGEPRDYRHWVEAVRAGRTVATTGPLLTLDVGEGRVAARVADPGGRVEVVVDGAVAAAGEGAAAAALPAGCGWAAARWTGPGGGFAHTSPVRLGPAGRPPEALAALRKSIADTRGWVETAGRFVNPKNRHDLLDRCDEAAARVRPSAAATGAPS